MSSIPLFGGFPSKVNGLNMIIAYDANVEQDSTDCLYVRLRFKASILCTRPRLSS